MHAKDNHGRTLALLCGWAANAQLLGDTQPAEVADLLMMLSHHPVARDSRGQTLWEMFTALAPVLWTTHDDAELWRHLRDAPVCDGLVKYLWTESLDPVTPDHAAPTSRDVVCMQTGAALCIVLLSLSTDAMTVQLQRPAVTAAMLDVQRWAWSTLGVGQPAYKLEGMSHMLTTWLKNLVPYHATSLRQVRVLAKVASMLCIGLSCHEDEAQDTLGYLLEAVSIVGLLLDGPAATSVAQAA